MKTKLSLGFPARTPARFPAVVAARRHSSYSPARCGAASSARPQQSKGSLSAGKCRGPGSRSACGPASRRPRGWTPCAVWAAEALGQRERPALGPPAQSGSGLSRTEPRVPVRQPSSGRRWGSEPGSSAALQTPRPSCGWAEPGRAEGRCPRRADAPLPWWEEVRRVTLPVRRLLCAPDGTRCGVAGAGIQLEPKPGRARHRLLRQHGG